MSSTRDQAFIPLSKAAPSPKATGDDKLVVLTAVGDKAQPFRPLGQAGPPAPATTHQQSCEPKVSVQRDGDRVTGIHVQCSCGQVIEIACVY